jgi:hypothetical protein
VGFVVDKVALRQDFFEYFGFLCQSSFHKLLQSPSSIIWGWYNRAVLTAVQGTWSHPTKDNKKIIKVLMMKSGQASI